VTTTSGLQYLHDVAVESSHVWLAGSSTDVYEYSASTGTLQHTYTLPVSQNGAVAALVSDGTYVYVAARDQWPSANFLYRIDIATQTLDGTAVNLNCGGGENPTEVVNDGTFLWVSDMNTNSISKVDPSAWTTATCFTGFGSPHALYSDGTDVFVADNGLKKMSIATGIVTSIGTGQPYDGLTTTVTGGNGGQLWVNGWSNAYQVDPSSGAILNHVDNLTNINWIILQGSTLWAAQGNSYSISQIEASTAPRLTAADSSVLGYGNAPVRIAAGAVYLWAAVNGSGDSSLMQIAPGAEPTTTTSSTPTTAGPTTTEGATTTSGAHGGLATTGSELRGVAGLGALLLAAGLLVIPGRRKRTL
jgi:hypothetical protein